MSQEQIDALKGELARRRDQDIQEIKETVSEIRNHQNEMRLLFENFDKRISLLEQRVGYEAKSWVNDSRIWSSVASWIVTGLALLFAAYSRKLF